MMAGAFCGNHALIPHDAGYRYDSRWDLNTFNAAASSGFPHYFGIACPASAHFNRQVTGSFESGTPSSFDYKFQSGYSNTQYDAASEDFQIPRRVTPQPDTAPGDESLRVSPGSLHGVLFLQIEAKQYSHVDEQELEYAEIGYDPETPASIYSPYTPSANTEVSFVDSATDPLEPYAFTSSPRKSYSPLHLGNDSLACSCAANSFNSSLIACCARQSAQAYCAGSMRGSTGGYSFSSSNTSSTSSSFFLPEVQLGSGDIKVEQPNAPSQPDTSPRFVGADSIFVHSDVEADRASTVSAPASEEEVGRDSSSSSVTDDDGNDSDGTGKDTIHNEKDLLLIQLRQSGMSYREIKERGEFHEAESTLRGKYRMLTKSKHERVRRPEWSTRDDELLRAAVMRYNRERPAKVTKQNQRPPWKKISEYIKDHGGTYLFAPATCARRWHSLRQHSHSSIRSE